MQDMKHDYGLHLRTDTVNKFKFLLQSRQQTSQNSCTWRGAICLTAFQIKTLVSRLLRVYFSIDRRPGFSVVVSLVVLLVVSLVVSPVVSLIVSLVVSLFVWRSSCYTAYVSFSPWSLSEVHMDLWNSMRPSIPWTMTTGISSLPR